MENKSVYFDLISGQRYFHLIALKVESDYSPDLFWKDSGFSSKRKKIRSHDFNEFTVDQSRIITETSYYNGEIDYSINKNGEPPFQYDLFVIQLKKSGILVIGFPFKQLAKFIVKNLFESSIIKSKGSFAKATINKLIKINHENDFVYKLYSSHFSSIDLTLTGETNITSINLDGEQPLESWLYKKTFKDLIERDECKLEKCALRFTTYNADNSEIPKTKSIIHVDHYGNYKLYIHGNGNNIFTIPHMFNLLKKQRCLDYTFTNPIGNINEK
ncbi:hypothetical protein [Chitinophaga sp. Ak27]|uniref:hypothetical protein n=1 Tax=Chitinophaga sp. Ak27 TaxID=2726116 RepID=UPI00145E04F0|nr:hypothetical protein [Chitinophaga sp. Ak27]NLU92310.1 hypothetical protein [Chitinophaga sp. Ak27]